MRATELSPGKWRVNPRRTRYMRDIGHGLLLEVRWVEGERSGWAVAVFGQALYTLARIPDEEIARLRSREDQDGLIPLEAPSLSRGDPVRVMVKGAGLLDAIYDGMSGRDREFVLLKILGRWTRTEVRAEDLHND